MEKQQLAFLDLPKGIEISSVCRKECINLDSQPSIVIDEPYFKVEKEMEEVSDFVLPMRNEKE